MRIYLAAAFVVVSAAAAFADSDRPVTDAERAKIVDALKAQGCTIGGTVEFDDDGYFKADNAQCSDGHVYDFKFRSSDYQLLEKDFEH
ncbi:PepSY domain-containing protein [Segnochrobactrum spirostomi]|uniref:PepSY domain-containing protein n=1 Tax=Segnochrobactrum spirostomi TaxID=2608987 RepID=A0A6A7XYJ6_9HYPH|nr:PepSY domain-containing protein [Segnochrobactrum spirostomi]MQT11408.1 hypothetical protein [Segnochrobactrum spirostomi]